MTRKKLWPGNYDWSPVVMEYMANKSVPCLDAVVTMSPAIDKSQECLYAQIVAAEWGLA